MYIFYPLNNSYFNKTNVFEFVSFNHDTINNTLNTHTLRERIKHRNTSRFLPFTSAALGKAHHLSLQLLRLIGQQYAQYQMRGHECRHLSAYRQSLTIFELCKVFALQVSNMPASTCSGGRDVVWRLIIIIVFVLWFEILLN